MPPKKKSKKEFKEDQVEERFGRRKEERKSSVGSRKESEKNDKEVKSSSSASKKEELELVKVEREEEPERRELEREKEIKKGEPRNKLDFRRNTKGKQVFERKEVGFGELLKDPKYAEKAQNEIMLNTHAERTELGRITVRNKWREFCIAENREEDVKKNPPSEREIVIFCGLLRCAHPQSALTYASSWKAWVESERKQSFAKMGEGLQEAYSKCTTALAAAKGQVHKDAPLAPNIFVMLAKKVKGEKEELVLKMAIFAFWALLRMDEFENLVVEKSEMEVKAQVQSMEDTENCRRKEIQNWKSTLRSGASFEKKPAVEKRDVASSSRVRKKAEVLKIRIKRSKTKIGDSGLKVAFFCACAWSKQIGMRRGISLCPVHVMDEEDFINAKLAKKGNLRESLDEIFRKIGIKNKPQEKGERRTYNLHSSRRGGAKYAIYSLGAPGISTLGRWSHKSGTAMQEYVEEALCDPVSGPVPTWPLVASTLKLVDISES